MAKLSAVIAALALNEATKALGDELKTQIGTHADVEVTDLVAQLGRVSTAETANKELTEQVAKLGDELKASGAKVTTLETDKRESIVAGAFAKAAAEHGINANAIATAQALAAANLGKLNVDLEKKAVEGLTKEFFDGLKTAHPVLTVATATIPPLPANNGGGAVAKYTRADMAAGKVDPKDVLSGKAEIVD